MCQENTIQGQEAVQNLVMANYDATDGVDSDRAMQDAVAQLRNVKFDENDLDFFFNQAEIKMKSAGVKKNFTKLEVLTTILPHKVIEQVKPILRKQETDFPQKDAYLQCKKTIIRIFGPSKASHFQRAMSRVLTDKPSTLAREIINDMCEHELTGCCCHKWVFGVWHKALPSAVKQAVAHHEFNKDTMEQVLKLADNVYESTRPSQQPVAAIESQALDEGFHQNWSSYAGDVAGQADVAALRRGGFRGRGGRGRGGAPNNRGAAAAQGSRPFYTKENPRWTTPRHPDLPPFHACKKHWQWGKSCHKCDEPQKCPWKKFVSPKNTN